MMATTFNATEMKVFAWVSARKGAWTAQQVATGTGLSRPKASGCLFHLKAAGLLAVRMMGGLNGHPATRGERIWFWSVTEEGRKVDAFPPVPDMPDRFAPRFVASTVHQASREARSVPAVVANLPGDTMKGMKFTMTERRILTHLGRCEAPVTVVEIAQVLRLPYAAERATGPLWGLGLVEREVKDEGGDVVSQVWTLSPRGRQVVEAGFMVHPRDRAVHIVRGPWALPASTSSPMARAYFTPTTAVPVVADPADAWLASLPKAPAAVAQAVPPTVAWLYDGSQMVARTAERTEHTVTLSGVTVLRAGFLFTQVDQRLPFLVLRENSVIGLGPLDEQDPS